MPFSSWYTFNVFSLDPVELYWLRKNLTLNLPLRQVMAHLMQVHKSITTLQGEDIVFLATDINLPGDYLNGFRILCLPLQPPLVNMLFKVLWTG